MTGEHSTHGTIFLVLSWASGGDGLRARAFVVRAVFHSSRKVCLRIDTQPVDNVGVNRMHGNLVGVFAFGSRTQILP